MNTDVPEQDDTVTTRVKLSGESWEIQASLSVPAGPIRLRTMLPLVQSFADAVVGAVADAVEGQGRRISCKKGCGACCRQLVPISEVEARHLASLVEVLPEPRQSQVRARFAEAHRRLTDAGLLEKLRRRQEWEEGEGRAVGDAYFRQGIPCPFLEEESCSIHADRPIVCREYLVTSPAENCAKPTADTINRVRLPMKLWPALALFDDVGPEARFIRWVPLVLALDWVAEQPEDPAPRPGPELLRRFLKQLTAQDCAPLLPDTTGDAGSPQTDPATPPDPAAEDASCPQMP
jgi:Fe-S-cluster containining protein